MERIEKARKHTHRTAVFCHVVFIVIAGTFVSLPFSMLNQCCVHRTQVPRQHTHVPYLPHVDFFFSFSSFIHKKQDEGRKKTKKKKTIKYNSRRKLLCIRIQVTKSCAPKRGTNHYSFMQSDSQLALSLIFCRTFQLVHVCKYINITCQMNVCNHSKRDLSLSLPAVTTD